MKDPWWLRGLLIVFALFLIAILSAGITLVIVLFIDWLVFPVPPHFGRSQIRYHNMGLIKRMGWGTVLVVFVLTFIATSVYGYLRLQIEREVD
jgi:hypothetical protein